MVRLGSVLEPKYGMIRCLLAVLKEVSARDSSMVWDKLSNCNLLPALPSRSSSRGETESVVQYYRLVSC